MTTTVFYVLLFLPSFAFAFAVLAALYDAGRAYIAVSWMPLTLYAVVYVLRQLSVYQPSIINWPEILSAVAWTGLLQCVFGAALAARAVAVGKGYAGLLAAACLAGVPYLLSIRV